MKRCSILNFTREMHYFFKNENHYIRIECPKSRTLEHQEPARMRGNRTSHSLLLGVQNGTVTLEDALVISYVINIILLFNPAITLLGIYPN